MYRLEVIVTSETEAVTAATGGADRLELVRELDTGGLTPEWETVRAVTEAVSIPVRVMLRENASMSVENAEELETLVRKARKLQELPLDGLVMGWVTDDKAVDVASLRTILDAVPSCNITFHRAFEHLADPFEGLRVLKSFQQIDRILTGGGHGSWLERRNRLRDWSKAAAPEIAILAGGGLATAEAAELMADPQIPEVHVGRAARTPAKNDGALDADKIALLKSRRGE
jgi:copper homeostasis protein